MGLSTVSLALNGNRSVPGAGEPLSPSIPYLGHRPSVLEALNANGIPVLTLKDQKDLDHRNQQEQREIKQFKQELPRKGKALASSGIAVGRKKIQAF